MYEYCGYIITYNVKTDKWLIKKDGIIVNEISGIKEAKIWCKENKQ